VYVRKLPEKPKDIPYYGFWLRTVEPPGYQTCKINVLSQAETLDRDRFLIPPSRTPFAGIISIKAVGTRESDCTGVRWLTFGFDSEFNPVVYMTDGWAYISETDRRPEEGEVEEAVRLGPRSRAHAKVFQRHTWLTEERSRHDQCRTCRLLKVDKNTGAIYEFLKLKLRIVLQVLPDRMPRGQRD
jgi:hypothetical protein